MDKMREEFEAWVVTVGSCIDSCSRLCVDNCGEYIDFRTRERWFSWKASRAALCVKLPEIRVLDGGRVAEIGYEMAIDDFESVLDAAGIRYK